MTPDTYFFNLNEFIHWNPGQCPENYIIMHTLCGFARNLVIFIGTVCSFNHCLVPRKLIFYLNHLDYDSCHFCIRCFYLNLLFLKYHNFLQSFCNCEWSLTFQICWIYHVIKVTRKCFNLFQILVSALEKSPWTWGTFLPPLLANLVVIISNIAPYELLYTHH